MCDTSVALAREVRDLCIVHTNRARTANSNTAKPDRILVHMRSRRSVQMFFTLIEARETEPNLTVNFVLTLEHISFLGT
jgi:hypothetical protein